MKKILSKTESGVWIDHKKAVLVTLENDTVVKHMIDSDFDRQTQTIRGNDSPGKAQRIVPEQKLERRTHQFLDHYYNEVADLLAKAGRIYLFGPSEAKYELKAILGKRNDTKHIPLELEKCDVLTDNQIAAKVREHFRPETKRH